MANTNIKLTILIITIAIWLGEASAHYVPKRIIECEKVLYWVSYETQVATDKKYNCKKIWESKVREIIINLPSYQ